MTYKFQMNSNPKIWFGSLIGSYCRMTTFDYFWPICILLLTNKKTLLNACDRSILGFSTFSLLIYMILGGFEDHLVLEWVIYLLGTPEYVASYLEASVRFACNFEAWLCSHTSCLS